MVQWLGDWDTRTAIMPGVREIRGSGGSGVPRHFNREFFSQLGKTGLDFYFSLRQRPSLGDIQMHPVCPVTFRFRTANKK